MVVDGDRARCDIVVCVDHLGVVCGTAVSDESLDDGEWVVDGEEFDG